MFFGSRCSASPASLDARCPVIRVVAVDRGACRLHVLGDLGRARLLVGVALVENAAAARRRARARAPRRGRSCVRFARFAFASADRLGRLLLRGVAALRRDEPGCCGAAFAVVLEIEPDLRRRSSAPDRIDWSRWRPSRCSAFELVDLIEIPVLICGAGGAVGDDEIEICEVAAIRRRRRRRQTEIELCVIAAAGSSSRPGPRARAEIEVAGPKPPSRSRAAELAAAHRLGQIVEHAGAARGAAFAGGEVVGAAFAACIGGGTVGGLPLGCGRSSKKPFGAGSAGVVGLRGLREIVEEALGRRQIRARSRGGSGRRGQAALMLRGLREIVEEAFRRGQIRVCPASGARAAGDRRRSPSARADRRRQFFGAGRSVIPFGAGRSTMSSSAVGGGGFTAGIGAGGCRCARLRRRQIERTWNASPSARADRRCRCPSAASRAAESAGLRFRRGQIGDAAREPGSSVRADRRARLADLRRGQVDEIEPGFRRGLARLESGERTLPLGRGQIRELGGLRRRRDLRDRGRRNRSAPSRSSTSTTHCAGSITRDLQLVHVDELRPRRDVGFGDAVDGPAGRAGGLDHPTILYPGRIGIACQQPWRVLNGSQGGAFRVGVGLLRGACRFGAGRSPGSTSSSSALSSGWFFSLRAAGAGSRVAELVLDLALERREHDEHARDLRRREDLSQLGERACPRGPRTRAGSRATSSISLSICFGGLIRRRRRAGAGAGALDEQLDRTRRRTSRAAGTAGPRGRSSSAELLGQRVRAHRADRFFTRSCLVSFAAAAPGPAARRPGPGAAASGRAPARTPARREHEREHHDAEPHPGACPFFFEPVLGAIERVLVERIDPAEIVGRQQRAGHRRRAHRSRRHRRAAAASDRHRRRRPLDRRATARVARRLGAGVGVPSATGVRASGGDGRDRAARGSRGGSRASAIGGDRRERADRHEPAPVAPPRQRHVAAPTARARCSRSSCAQSGSRAFAAAARAASRRAR